MHSFIERRLRGAHSYISKRFSGENNKYTKGYDSTKEST